MTVTPSLAAVTARARAGATNQAWRLFREGGFERVEDDPAVLAVRGRLLKDQARAAADPAERRRLRLAAGEAYAAAGALEPARTYPPINAATLAFLAGDQAAARARAEAVLGQGDDPEETAYYQAATRAEALLLLGRTAESRAALETAVARAPRAWEDHASTLRQFRTLLAGAGESAAWVEMLRPPRCLHYAGHMAPAEPAALAREVQALLEREEIGFGFGALAAGADLLIAEALLARGAELHVVLPAEPRDFARGSVGENWAGRFERALAQAETVRVVGGGASTTASSSAGPRSLDIELAAEAAMGAAAMFAASLATDAVQLLVLDGAGAIESGVSGGPVRRLWRRAQHVLGAPRGGGALEPAPPPGEGEMLAALLAATGVEDTTALAELLAEGPTLLAPPRWAGGGLQLAYARPHEAAETALRLLDALGERLRLGGDYGVVKLAADPNGDVRVGGGPPRLAEQIVSSTLAGAAQVSETFAQALHAGDDRVARVQTEFVGDLPGSGPKDPVGLFALIRRAGEG